MSDNQPKVVNGRLYSWVEGEGKALEMGDLEG